jgi:hypothetical protein
MATYRRMNRAARQRRPYRRHDTRRFFRGRFLFFGERRALGRRGQHGRGRHRCDRDSRLGSGGVVSLFAVRFFVVDGGIVRVRIVHVVRDVLSVILTQLDGYVFID